MKKLSARIALMFFFALSLFSFDYVNQFKAPQSATKLEFQNVTESGDNLIIGIKAANVVVQNVKKVLTNS